MAPLPSHMRAPLGTGGKFRLWHFVLYNVCSRFYLSAVPQWQRKITIDIAIHIYKYIGLYWSKIFDLTQTANAVRISARSNGHSSVLIAFSRCHADTAVSGRRVTWFVVKFDYRE